MRQYTRAELVWMEFVPHVVIRPHPIGANDGMCRSLDGVSQAARQMPRSMHGPQSVRSYDEPHAGTPSFALVLEVTSDDTFEWR